METNSGEDGAIRIYQGYDGQYHSYRVWIYTGDGGGPNSNGWHVAVPKICVATGDEKSWRTCG